MDKKKFFLNLSVFILCFVLALPYYNAAVSIGTGLSALAVIACCRQYKLLGLSDVPKSVYVPLLVYGLSVMVAPLIDGDMQSVNWGWRMCYWMLPFVLFYLSCKQIVNKYAVLAGFHLALLVSSIPAILEFQETGKRVWGLYGQPNHFASMLDILLPFCVLLFVRYILSAGRNYFLALLLVCNLGVGFVAMVLSGSRGGMLGVIVGLVVALVIYAFKNYGITKAIIILLIGACAIGGLQHTLDKYDVVDIHRSYDYERVRLVKSSYHMWQDHKLTGVGFANWAEEYQQKYILPDAREPKLDMPHNVLAYYFSATGLIGGIGFCILMLGIMVYLFNNLLPVTSGGIFAFAMLWALLAINIHGMVDVGITLKSAARLFYGCLGITVAEIYKLQKQK